MHNDDDIYKGSPGVGGGVFRGPAIVSPLDQLGGAGGYGLTEVKSPFKYNEAEILQELHSYLLSTYGQHYIGANNIQANDIFLANDAIECRGFWKNNAIKYLLRYGKKRGLNRDDLLKAAHYVILLLYLDSITDKEKK